MTKQTVKKTAARKTKASAKSQPRRETRADQLIRLMRGEGGKTAQELAKATGWQVHSVRGFISGTLKKRASLEVVVSKIDGATRYSVRDQAGQA